jgi:hypothetical protein
MPTNNANTRNKGKAPITECSKPLVQVAVSDDKGEKLPRVRIITRPKPYLYLPTLSKENQYIITMAPMNSSGDIYHILAYLMLAIEYGNRIPKVELTYDIVPSDKSARPTKKTLSTFHQANRGKLFADTLGLQNFVTVRNVSASRGLSNSYRENSRQSYLTKDLQARSKQGNPIYYIDQIATTHLIASHVMEFGYAKTAKILQRRFAFRNPELFPQSTQNHIDDFVKNIMMRISNIQKSPNQKLIILHIRHSSHANEKQNFPDTFIKPFKIMLQEKGFQLCLILADDRNNNSYYVDPPHINPEDKHTVECSPFKDKSCYDAASGKDYAKQQHLQLLLSLAKYKNTWGIIGNTSGTLDLAAFIGIATYNIHTFTESKISYQECRLYFQLVIFSIDKLEKEQTAKYKYNFKLSDQFESWLTAPGAGMGHTLFPYQSYQQIQTHITSNDAANKNHYTKMFFITNFTQGRKQTSEALPELQRVCDYVPTLAPQKGQGSTK